MHLEKKVKSKKIDQKSPFRKVSRAEAESAFERYLNEPSLKNTMELTRLIRGNAAYEILARFPIGKELIKHGRMVFSSEVVFLDYLFGTSWVFGGKMPIELFTDEKGVQTIIDELVRIEHGILC